MNTFDKQLAATIGAMQKPEISEAKRVNQISERRLMRERIREIGLDSRAETLLAGVLSTSEDRPNPSTDDTLFVVRALRERGLIKVAAALFERWKQLYREFRVEDIKREAPDAKSLEAWRKEAGLRVDEMAEKLLSNLPATYDTAGADWLLLRGNLEWSLPMLRFYLEHHARPKHLPHWADAIAERLRHDKRGSLLGCVLSRGSENGNEVKALAEVVRINRSLLLMVIDLLPRIASRRDATSSVVVFVREILMPVIESQGSDREFLTAALARLGSGVLLERPGGQTRACLEFVQKMARQLRNVTREEDLRAKTWVLENLCVDDLPGDAGLHITIDGARELALAMDKAQQGFDAKEILAVAARNLGLVPFGKKGETVHFAPIRHQDIEGGILPGDRARIEEGGWSYEDDVIIRAKVKQNKE